MEQREEGATEQRSTILVVEDDRHTWRFIEVMCRGQAYDLLFAANGQEALELVKKGTHPIHLVISDVMMPEMGGEDLLELLRKEFPRLPVVLMTSHGSIDSAVKFLKAGAVDYITKPLHREVFLHRISTVLAKHQLTQKLHQLRRKLVRVEGADSIVGQSKELMGILKKLPSIAKTDASVIIYGESGTGKELVAKAVHQLSKRSRASMVTMNCGALPENLLETELFGYKKGAFTDAVRDSDGLVKEADGGTLFLDEIGEIPLNLQAKLLRFLQEKEYKPIGSSKVSFADVRFVSATNRDLRKEVGQGRFREDLFYRLNIIPLTLPPLRQRRDDIPLLVDHFVRKYAVQTGREGVTFAPASIQKFLNYSWPGNIRELENKILQAIVMNDRDVLLPEHISLPEEDSKLGGMGLDQAGGLKSFKAEKQRVVAQFEREYIGRMLMLHQGNISKAARASGMDRKNFWQKMQRYGINPKNSPSGLVFHETS